MRTVFSEEELKQELKVLQEEKANMFNQRMSALKKFKHTQPEALMHDLERKIECVEDKIKKLF